VKIWGEEKPVAKTEAKTEDQLGIDF